MDWDRYWKWAERGSTIILVLCGLGGTYYAAGTYYGWDKQQPPSPITNHAGEAAVTLPPTWIPFALLGAAALLLFTMWAMILIRWQLKKNSTPPAFGDVRVVSLNEIQFNTSQIWDAAPWLELYLTFFNASQYTIRPVEIEGRIKVLGQEYHGHFELMDTMKWSAGAEFFKVEIKIPISSSEAKFLSEAIGEAHIQLSFPNGKLTFQLATPIKSTLIYFSLPDRVLRWSRCLNSFSASRSGASTSVKLPSADAAGE